jgi:hypothetical protein
MSVENVFLGTRYVADPQSRAHTVLTVFSSGGISMTVSTPSSPACIADLDNLLHRGFTGVGSARPQARLDVLGLSVKLRNRGVMRGTICRNHEFPTLAAALWSELGFRVVATRANCDDQVICESQRYAEQGARMIVLVAGDGDYCDLVKKFHLRGIHVEVWARRGNISRRLVKLADSVEYIDEFAR